MRYRLTILLLFLSFITSAQRADSSIFGQPLQMDAVVVSAVRGGWDVNSFIRRIKNDTTFYKAFRSMHFMNYNAVNDIKVLDKNGKVSASYYSKSRQTFAGGCRTMQVTEEKVTGDFFKSGRRYRYYTAELYDYLFFTHDKVCNESEVVKGALDNRGKGQLEKSKYQLKQLIFNPGSKVSGIPLMGDKAAIFEPSVAKLYDFKLQSDEYDGEECYVFRAIPKKGNESDVVYDELSTWFRKSDYFIVARDYSLSYKTVVYDFRVHMKVRTAQIGKRLLPTRIDYDGNWHVFSKNRERVKFTAILNYL
jgi:hypothetical protein